MDDAIKSKDMLISELTQLRKRLADLERSASKRTENEESMKVTIAEFREFIDNIPVGVYKTKVTGEILYANEALAESTGFDSADELVSGSVMARYKNVEDRDELIDRLQRTGAVQSYECEMLTKGGESKHMLFNAKMEDDVISGTAIDISKRKRAEEQLRKSEERYRSLVNTAASIIIVLSPDGCVSEFNPEAERILKRKRVDVLGASFFRLFITGEFRDEVEAKFNEVLSGSPVRGYEVPVRSADGDTHILSWSISRRLNSSGQLTGMIAVGQDITEKKQVEEAFSRLYVEAKRTGDALRESEKRYRSLFNDSPVALWEEDHSNVIKYIGLLKERGITDFEQYFDKHPEEVLQLISSRIIVNANKAALSLFKADSKHELLEGQNRIFTDDTYNAFKRWFINIAQGKTEFETETSTRSMTNDTLFVTIKSSVAPSFEKTQEKVLISIMDITDRKEMEEELLKIKKLDSVGVLAGGIAHDFNNLLMAVLGNLNLIKIQASPDDQVIERLKEAEKATLKAKDLTQQLLTFSRGGMPIRKAASILELIKESVKFSLRGSNVRCEYSITPDLWPVEIDSVQISQVISNMIINADQAMPDGGKIGVQAENIVLNQGDGIPLAAGNYIKITIEDHGIGMSWDHLQKAFDPYFTTKQKGSGLGLATAYSIIKNHDGYVTAESVLGKGTKFYIYLPASEKKIEVIKDQKEEILSGSGKILLMDDEESVREVAGEMLSQIGYEVEYAANGNEAIEKYIDGKKSDDPFNAVIMDLTIPGYMGGRETIKKLLELDPQAKSIVSSGYSNDPIMANYSEYGFKEVIKKPYTIKELGEVLQKVLKAEK